VRADAPAWRLRSAGLHFLKCKGMCAISTTPVSLSHALPETQNRELGRSQREVTSALDGRRPHLCRARASLRR
jgi:hypothetical protein